MLFQAHHCSSEAAQQRNALHTKGRDLSRGVLLTESSSCGSAPWIHESSPVPCSPQAEGQSSFVERYTETNRRRQRNSTVSPTGQDVTPKRRRAWRPRLRASSCAAPQTPPRAPARSRPAGTPSAARARCRQGWGQHGLGAAGCLGGAQGSATGPPSSAARRPTSRDVPQTGEKARNSGLRLSVISLAARLALARLVFRLSLNYTIFDLAYALQKQDSRGQRLMGLEMIACLSAKSAWDKAGVNAALFPLARIPEKTS